VKQLAIFVGAVVALAALSLTIGPWLLALGVVPTPPQLHDLRLADDAATSVAGATLFLALFTAASVAEGRRERLVSERALEASWRPMLVDVPIGELVQHTQWFSSDAGRPSLQVMNSPKRYVRPTVPLLNAGSGPAVITAASLMIQDKPSRGVPQMSSSIVPPGHVTTVLFDLPLDEPAVEEMAEALKAEGKDRPPWVAEVRYGDQAATGEWITEVHVHPARERMWYVSQIRLLDARTRRVLVTSAPRAGDTRT
jgi:hypothetical protein